MQPFNPLLGETYQAGLPDGTHIFLEQISHHPPIAAFVLEGPTAEGEAESLYVFRGLSQPKVSYQTSGGLSIKMVALGERSITFRDGTRIDFVYPSYSIKGKPWLSASCGCEECAAGMARWLAVSLVDPVVPPAALSPAVQGCSTARLVQRSWARRSLWTLATTSPPPLPLALWWAAAAPCCSGVG